MKPWIGIAVLMLSPLTSLAAPITKVAGQVVDEQRRPIAGAQVASGWSVASAVMEPVRPARTDAEGRFALAVVLTKIR